MNTEGSKFQKQRYDLGHEDKLQRYELSKCNNEKVDMIQCNEHFNNNPKIA